MAWQAENTGEDQDQAVTKAVAALVENMLAREERRSVRATTAPVSKQAQQAAFFQNKVETTLQFLDRLGKKGQAQLAQELRTKETYAETIREVRQLQEHLKELLSALEKD